MEIFRVLIAAAICACATTSFAQTPAPAQPAKPTDIYHVLFAKAAPGQAAALAKQLQEPDPKDPMAAHFLLLRHQEGADWDYCLIQHVGTKASVEIPAAQNPAATASIAWHDDSFVSGPSWTEFQKVMGLGEQAGQPVYVVSVQRACTRPPRPAAAAPEPAASKRESHGEQPGDDPRRRRPLAVPHTRPLQLVAGPGHRPGHEHRRPGMDRHASTLRLPHGHDCGSRALVAPERRRRLLLLNRAPHPATRATGGPHLITSAVGTALDGSPAPSARARRIPSAVDTALDRLAQHCGSVSGAHQPVR